MDNTQLSTASGYNIDNMVFSDPLVGSIPGSGNALQFRRILISTKNKDGTVGDLVFETERLFSFGVSVNTAPDSGKVTGYTIPLCMWSRDNPTSDETAFTDTFNSIVEKCTDHLIENREEVDQFELQRSDLRKLNPLYWKKEKVKDPKSGRMIQQAVPGLGPTLYAKLMFSKKNDSFLTQFFDSSNNPLQPLDLVGKFCHVRAAIKIESIFIGNKISLQVKCCECEVELAQMGMKRLLSRPKTSNSLEVENAGRNTLLGNTNDEEDDDDDDGSIVGSEEEEEEVKKPVKRVKKVVRKVKKVVRKKAA